MKRVGLASVALAAALLATSSSAWAVSLSQGEIKLLKSILPHISYVGEGVGGKPTIQLLTREPMPVGRWRHASPGQQQRKHAA